MAARVPDVIRLRVVPGEADAVFQRDQAVAVGRGADSDVRVGDRQVAGLWTVSKRHLRIEWDDHRWVTTNVSDKTGLLSVYEPGYEDVPLEPGRSWTPARSRWSYRVGRPGHPFFVVCDTDDRPASAQEQVAERWRTTPSEDDEPTARLDALRILTFTPLERDVLLAYYSDFVSLPRPRVLEPRGHDVAARRLGRSSDSMRKAIERANDKMARNDGAPAIATGRNVSAEIGRWLARAGALDASPVEPGVDPHPE